MVELYDETLQFEEQRLKISRLGLRYWLLKIASKEFSFFVLFGFIYVVGQYPPGVKTFQAIAVLLFAVFAFVKVLRGPIDTFRRDSTADRVWSDVIELNDIERVLFGENYFYEYIWLYLSKDGQLKKRLILTKGKVLRNGTDVQKILDEFESHSISTERQDSN
jgi:hypothetical protein